VGVVAMMLEFLNHLSITQLLLLIGAVVIVIYVARGLVGLVFITFIGVIVVIGLGAWVIWCWFRDSVKKLIRWVTWHD